MKKYFALIALVFAFVFISCSGSSTEGDVQNGEDTIVNDQSEDSQVIPDGSGNDTVTPDAGETNIQDTDVINDTSPEPDVNPNPTDTNESITPNDTSSDQSDTGQQSSFYPASELYLKISSPSYKDTASVLGSVTALGGVVFGKYTKITWENVTTGATGEAVGAPFWKTGPITLAQGDNFIKVVAENETETSEDFITITYNPGFRWDGPLGVRPPAIFTSEPMEVIITAPMSFYKNFDSASVKLYEVDESGTTIKELGNMKDDGAANKGGSNSGDEYEGDGIYTLKVKFTCETSKIIYLRASAVVTIGAYQYTAYSPVQKLYCVDHITQAQCNEVVTFINQTFSVYKDKINSGMDPKQARDEVLSQIQGNSLVQEVGKSSKDGYGIWVYFKSGLLGAFAFGPQGTRTGLIGDPVLTTYNEPEFLGSNIFLQSKGVSLLSPFAQDFTGSDETQAIAGFVSQVECPPYDVSGPHLGNIATLDKFYDMFHSGIVSIVSHGDAYFDKLSTDARAKLFLPEKNGSYEVIWTGEAPVCSQFLQTSKSCVIEQGGDPNGGCPKGTICLGTKNSGNSIYGVCYDRVQIDLRLGRLVFGKTYGIMPGFVEHNALQPYPNSVIYLGACRSVFNGSMASAFFARGAKAVLGYSGYVTTQFANEVSSEFFQKAIVDKENLGTAFTPGQTDPEYPATAFMFFGANNLNLKHAEIVNASFETGDLTGWKKSGDGRVISKLGSTGPVSGKFMGVISSGMGYTLQVGSISQKFCIPEDKNTIQFYWNYFSEEFLEWCGSQFQDPFTAKLVGTVGQISLVDVTVDSLCPASECSGCGSKFVGVYDADVSFDQGDVHYTRWQKLNMNISGLSGTGPVELKFFVTDEGDSIYDTVILIDDIRFLTE